MATLTEKVNYLEEIMKRLAYAQLKTETELQEFKDEMKAFKDEMKKFKDEMKEFKDEMRAFKDEMKEFKDEMKEFKDKMDDFKQEMKEFKDWAKMSIESLNKRWGDLANKLGTIVEDIFAPSIDIVIEKYFGVGLEDISVNRLIRKGEDTLEIDILGISHNEKKAFVVEVKVNPDRIEYIERFQENLNKLKKFLPSLEDYELIGIYAGLDMKQETINQLTKRKIYAMIMRGDVFEIPNFEKVKK